MTIKKFAQYVFKSNKDVKVCYIAIIMNDDDEWDLEVEINEGSIGGVYAAETTDLEKARKLADELQEELTTLGWTVFYTRNEWQKYFNLTYEI